MLPYAINAGMALAAAALLSTAPETRARSDSGRRWWSDLAIPGLSHRRFLFVIVPLAPWVFGAGASAYAVLPALMADRVGSAPIAFSAVLCLVALGVGFTVQQVGRNLIAGGRTGVVVSLGLIITGMGLAAWAASVLTVPAALIAAAVLGAGYGMGLLTGLHEIQRIAGPDDLAGLTAVFYSLTYLGFAVPAVLAFLSRSLSYPVMFGFGVLAAGMCLIVAVVGSTRVPAIQ